MKTSNISQVKCSKHTLNSSVCDCVQREFNEIVKPDLEKLLRRSAQLLSQEANIRDVSIQLKIPAKQTEQLTNFANKTTLSEGNKDTILKVINDSLLKSDDRTRQRILRIVPQKVIKRILTDWTLKSQNGLIQLRSILPLIGMILQASNENNFLLLVYLTSKDARDSMKQVLENCSLELLIAIVRCLEAQPMLTGAWDLSSLLERQNEEFPQNLEVQLLIEHIKKVVYPQMFSTVVENNERNKQRINLVQSYCLNKTEEQRCRIDDNENNLDETLTYFENQKIVNTGYLNQKANAILDKMDEAPFSHICISGPQGSGKMALLTLTNELYKQRHSESISNAGIIVVTLEASFDSKNLVGTYVCNETGEFQFKKGPLTIAAEQGMWLVLRNIEETPSDLLSFLLPLIQENQLHVTSSMVIRPKLGFRLCFLKKISNILDDNHHSFQHEDIMPLTDLLFNTNIEGLTVRADFKEILQHKYPALFYDIMPSFTISDLIQKSVKFLNDQLSVLKPHLLDFRTPTVMQLLSLYNRINQHFSRFIKEQNQDSISISQKERQLIIEEISDVYLAYMYDSNLKFQLIQQLVQTQFNSKFESLLDADDIGEYCIKLSREHGFSNDSCFFGRTSMLRQKLNQNEEGSQKKGNFVYTSATLRLLEQIFTAIKMQETILLVGETGTGKTTSVQEIAKICDKKLHVFNLNQNTDSADLLGGFKPVDLKYLIKPIYENFLFLFTTLFTKTANNQKFLDLTQKCFEQSKIKEFCQCMQHGLTSIKSKKDPLLAQKTQQLEQQVKDLQKRTKKLESQGGFIFQFVEGTLIKSMQNGDWVLLDEINLASETILNKISTIIQGNHVLLNERADVIEMKIHPEFRVFMCMNPPYSSAGKKQLPSSLRCKLTEFYVPEIENESDLWSIIDRYTKSSQQSTLNEENKRCILQFYIQVKSLISKQTRRGNIGLRNLCRALRFMNAAIQLKYPVVKAIFDSLFACFASHLDLQLQDMVKQLIFTLFKIKKLPTLQITDKNRDERFANVEDCLILLGKHKPLNFDMNEFVLTPTFSQLVHQLAAVISVSDFAVILEGPTSAGKTSCINYLAKVTHNNVIRINNHMHTDVQEYLGSYVPDSATGKLVFQEGILVEAVRNGYWVILDELNLAPSEVLEALNRLLDDNRELHIVETQKVIKAHPKFRIFATQNPTEGYGGRKELSEAFKNRFVMIKVRDVPSEDLKIILEKKCNLPTSRATLMVKVMENLQIYRSQSSIFAGKESTITVRDLLKWAGRINSSSHLGSHVDQYQIALEGFLVLAERSRDSKDKFYIKQTIEKVFGIKLEIEQFYEQFFQQNLAKVFQSVPSELNLPPIILSKQLKRLAVLVYKCLINKEPVLLVGETGCGKTTLCQVFAHSVTHQQLFAINCHQNTETSDFIGCMRTRKTLNQNQDQPNINQLKEDISCIFEWTDGILVNAMQQGGLLLIDEISLANDSVLERLNSVFEHDRTLVISEKSAAEAVRVIANEQFNIVATMNPGSDFGKKELSPALRNRMTEIWVESYFTQEELIELLKLRKSSILQNDQVSDEIDLYLIIKNLCIAKLDQQYSLAVACGIFNLICFVNYDLSQRYFSMQRKSLSIRDILNVIDFISTNSKPCKFITEQLDIFGAFKNAIELVIIDGLCLGIDIAGENEKMNITQDCYNYLNDVLSFIFKQNNKIFEENFINTVVHIGVQPFVMPRTIQILTSSFAFEAKTTKKNLKKLLRALTLGKPVLIEGSPGVGKTSLVENLAKQTGKKLIRINLSDQTDMMDLLGSEYPLPASNSNDEGDQDIQFRWCDGVLLQAIKEGHWFLIDEMNLAQQSILEGLNAILDHRRTVYIPELNQEFVCHPDFFVFACQNPSQSSGQTSGRKTLPKSFLNRFAKIYLEDLTQEDYRVILNHQASDVFQPSQVECLLNITQKLNSLNNTDEKLAVNMRDLSRFLKLYRHYTGFSQQQQHSNSSIATALEVCYGNWQIGKDYGLIQFETQMPQTSLVRLQPDEQTNGQEIQFTFESLHTTKIIRSNNHQAIEQYSDNFSFGDYQDLKGPHAKTIQSLVDCLQANLPVLIVTNDPLRFSKALAVLAKIQGTKLRRILLNDRTDTTQLLGCFEQTSNDFNQLFNQIYNLSVQSHFPSQVMRGITKLQYDLVWATKDSDKLKLFQNFLESHSNLFGSLSFKLKQLQQGQSRFEWVDSVLVQAVQLGQWAAIENANLCNPSVLDRLNGLFEEGNQSLAINEQGLVNNNSLREVIKHTDFRVIFVITEKTLYEQGKDISKALRNRCLELQLHYQDPQMAEFDILNGEKISTEKGSLCFKLENLQQLHDQLPLNTNIQEVQQVTQSKLGKRNQPNIEYQNILSLGQSIKPFIAEKIRQTYPYFLSLLKRTDQIIPDQLSCFNQYLYSQLVELKTLINDKLKVQIIENRLTVYFSCLLSSQLKCQVDIEDFYLLLSELTKTKHLREINQDPFLIYLQSKVELGTLNQNPENGQLQHQNNNEKSNIPELSIAPEFNFIKEQVDFNVLTTVSKPNSTIIKQLKVWLDQVPQSVGEVFCYRLPLNNVFTKQHESRFRTILRLLKFSGATIIMIDAEKEITANEDKIVKWLEENCFDTGSILHTPNIVIIPKSLEEGVVVQSQSYVYQVLCFIKDFLKLKSTKIGKIEHYRMTKIPALLQCMRDETSEQELSLVLRQITLQILEKAYMDQKPYQLNLIKAVLEDEQSIALKDLPASYVCAHSLLFKLQKLTQGNSQGQEFRQQQIQFQELAQRTLLNSEVDTQLKDALIQKFGNSLSNKSINQNDAKVSQILRSIDLLSKAFQHIQGLKTAEIIRAIFILPLELKRQQNIIQLRQDEIEAENFFWNYHLRDSKQPEFLLQNKSENLIRLQQDLLKLQELNPSSEDYTQNNLRNTLMFIDVLRDDFTRLRQNLIYENFSLTASLDSLANLIYRQIDTIQFASVSNILKEMLICVATALTCCKEIFILSQQISDRTETIVSLQNLNQSSPFLISLFKQGQQLPKDIHELQMKWIIKQTRLHKTKDFRLQSAILEHFIQREVIKRMLKEEASALKFTLPFAMREQTIPDAPVGKAMDTWTAADKAKMEAEAEKEIEVNFPSYFDEVQKAYYSGEFMKDQFVKQHEEVSINDVLAEILEINPSNEPIFRSHYLSERLTVVQAALEQESQSSQIQDYTDWVDDVQSYLIQGLNEQKLKQVMNISDVQLAKSYNFYHSPLPQECKLIYQPLIQLQMRLRDITIRDQYESPLLNESLFLSNYMLACFNVEVTPLMKILTCTEFLLTKLEEWENTYASKRLNSVETEINNLKLLVIRYRKIQIISWRNLLNWKQDKLIREDFDNAVRLAHTVTKQVFEGQEDIIKILDLCDLYIRDSTLGTFKPRLGFILILKSHMQIKQSLLVKASQRIQLRLQQTINSLEFVYSYYSQFKSKLEQTISRLDSTARDKVKTLIDIKKWTLQKFTIMKSNVDKTHRQLNKACKGEEEILIQNVQSLVLVASRKKYGGQNDQLLNLDLENRTKILSQLEKFTNLSNQISVVKQLSFLENSKILPQWPSCVNLQESIDTFMERLEEVRALNKKYLQKKAFYDLLKYMKDEGLRPNFHTEFQPLLLECRSQSQYFVKAYETFVMLKSSVQSEENPDLKNVDVLRCLGFSQHLMHRCLEQTLLLQKVQNHLSQLDFIESESINKKAEIDSDVTTSHTLQFGLTETSCRQLKLILKNVQDSIYSICQQLGVQYELMSNDAQNLKIKSEFSLILAKLEQLGQQLPLSVTHTYSTFLIFDNISKVLLELEGLQSLVTQSSQRGRRIIEQAIQVILNYQKSLQCYLISDGVLSTVSKIQQKRQQTLEQKVKLFYQEMFKLVDSIQQKEDNRNVDSVDNNSTTAGNKIMLEDQPIFTIEERLQFSEQLDKIIGLHLPLISKTGQKMLTMVGVDEFQTAESLQNCVQILQKTKHFITNICKSEQTYLDSMSKFSYLTQRVFLYLIYQGFCGQEEEDDPDVEPPSDLEKDGMGMGDGKGGDENVADQIEHEEQLEGLKNYESDDQKEEEQQSQNDDNKEDEENDFEMKEDFDGEMDSEQKSQKSNEKSDDDDDQLDEVDDMLDNDLWNKNMEDMEQQEQKEQEEKEKREQDLGDRELQDENVMDQDSQMAEGDHDERENKSDKQDQSDQEMKDNDASMAEEDQRDGDEEERQDSDSQDIGLNNESVPAEPDEEFSQESKDEEDKSMGEDSDADKGSDESEIDSKFEEENQQDMSGSNDEQNEGDEKDDELDVKNDVNQAVLEDDQIQANEKNKDKNDQANLKRQQEQKVDSSNNNPQQDKKPDQVDSQQIDPNGSDILFNFAQQLQQRQQSKQQQQEKKSEQNEKKAAKEVQDPNMIEQQQSQNDQLPQQDDLADEYMQDEQAQQHEGKLATDKAKENAAQDDQAMKEEPQLENNLDQIQEDLNEVEMTQQQAQNNLKQNLNTKDQQEKKEGDIEDIQMNDQEEITLDDLIDQYNKYLEEKQQKFDLTANQQDDLQQNQGLGTRIIQNLDAFDYLHQKQLIRQMFNSWQSDQLHHQESLDLLAKFKNQTQHITSSLCEQLRIVLEPQLSQNLQGDFKTGKRLNMKKVISFIASNYRNDKIWLRRTLPSKRDYKILIAIDDSLSMKESNLGFFCLEASVALGEALNRLEVGKVAVARIRDRLELVQSFEDQYTNERAAHIVSQFNFKHFAQTSADTSMANFVSDSNKLLDMQNSGNAVSCPFVIVLSDGRFNKENVRRYMREAKEKKYLYIFVILDQKQGDKKGGDQSIMQMKSAVKQQNGQIKLDSYMKDFPFDYYCVVSDTSQLPSALGTILVQWFSMVSNSNN